VRTIPADTAPVGNIPFDPNIDRTNWREDHDTFQAETVYFDFDKSNIKPSEVGKIRAVAEQFKAMSAKALRIDGHCDERGTEEYNRSLGERRALSIREALVREGVAANLIDTRTYGEERPAEPGHDEAAWARNRRGEFIVLSPQ
jgi:peptidoglycan-associated lipoprotein